MTVLFVFAAGLIYGRCVASESRHEASLHLAAQALEQAISGDEAAWEEAEAAYGKASRASLLDPYPLWVLEVITAWRKDQPMGSDPAVLEILRAIRAGDYVQARRGVDALPPSKGQEFIDRLVSDLGDAKKTRTAP